MCRGSGHKQKNWGSKQREVCVALLYIYDIPDSDILLTVNSRAMTHRQPYRRSLGPFSLAR
jgi:hypothetical protein